MQMKVVIWLLSVTKTINGVQYTFDDKGNMIAGSERTAQDYSLGNLEGIPILTTGQI